jgi:hypothetical protein
MKSIRILMLILVTSLVSAIWSQAQAGQKHELTTFDIPGAGTGSGQGTLPVGIVQGGWIMGTYIDANNVSHGFLRAPDGAITKFDVPGAGTSPFQGTAVVRGMNPALEIVGAYFDENNVLRGFSRNRFGKFTTFDCPGAGTSSYQAESESVNAAGLISADYLDVNGVWHGCLRAPDGTFTRFDPPDAGTVPGSFQGTYPAIFSGINPEGATVGEYIDENYVIHAYLRAADGSITEFDDPNAGTGFFQGSGTSGINPAGEINGWYIDENYVFHGYLRAPDSTITPVDVPGAGTGTFQGTNAAEFMPAFGGINPAGTITGFYADANSVYHGYIRTARGNFVTFDVPGAGTGDWQGTLPLNINPEGAITGWYIDGSGVYHGFLRNP